MPSVVLSVGKARRVTFLWYRGRIMLAYKHCLNDGGWASVRRQAPLRAEKAGKPK